MIGKDGSVTYSNVAPNDGAESSVLEGIPEPTEADRLAAEQRLQEIRDRAEQRRAEREEREELEQQNAAEEDEDV